IAQPGMNMQMVGGNDGNQFRQYAGQNVGNQNGYNAVQNVENQVAQNPRVQNDGNQNQIGNGNLVAVRAEGNAAGHNGNQIRCYNCRGVGHFARDYTVRPRRKDDAYLQTQLLIAQKEEAGIQLQAEEYDLMAVPADLDEIEEEQYTELLEPIPEPQQVLQNDNNVISEVTDVEQDGETVKQHSANFEETRALYESLYQNLAVEVEKVNSVNRKLKETNADLTIELASCETDQEIWLRVQQMMKGSYIGIQEKKAKLFNEWERFTSNKGESIESYYHRFLMLMNDLKRNKHFPKKIASNLKFLNNLQPE
nr:hypothetical protein [Tanacetum cinerariifolium]